MSGHTPWSQIRHKPLSPQQRETARLELEREIAAYERSLRGRWDRLRDRVAARRPRPS